MHAVLQACCTPRPSAQEIRTTQLDLFALGTQPGCEDGLEICVGSAARLDLLNLNSRKHSQAMKGFLRVISTFKASGLYSTSQQPRYSVLTKPRKPSCILLTPREPDQVPSTTTTGQSEIRH